MSDSNIITVFIVAGEISGDMYGARLIRDLRKLAPETKLSFHGIGGDAMHAEGVEILYHTDEMATMGFWEVFRKLLFFRKAFKRTCERIERLRPDVLVTIDYPGFNLRLGAWAHAHGIPTVQYICPKVWVWKKNRIPKIAEAFNRLLCIFPFEPALFAQTKLTPNYIGNPLVGEINDTLTQPEPELPWQGSPRVALLPGSREGEIRRLMPVLIESVNRLLQQHPNASFIIPVPTKRLKEIILRDYPVPNAVRIIDGQARWTLRQADAAVVASGTATLESAIIKCPTVLIYQMAPVTAAICRVILRDTKYVGLPNIICDAPVIPELLQENCTTDNILAKLISLLDAASPERARMLEGCHTIQERLGTRDASREASEIILELVREHQPSA